MSIQTLLESTLQSILPDEDYINISYVVAKKTGCWDVLGRARNRDGYPVARIKGELDTLYRHFYKRYKGPIDSGVVIRHTCDNRSCCNPDHLIPGSQKDNVGDMLARNRFPKGIKHGRAKLNDDAIRDIKVQYNKDNQTITTIAKQYDVDRKTIHKVVNGITWVGVGESKRGKK